MLVGNSFLREPCGRKKGIRVLLLGEKKKTNTSVGREGETAQLYRSLMGNGSVQNTDKQKLKGAKEETPHGG